MFKKNKNSSTAIATRSEFLFQEMVRETNELYEELKTEYDAIENVITEFEDFSADISRNLDEAQKNKLEDFMVKLKKVNTYTQNSVRDVRDLLRNQKKILSEIKREQ